MIQRIQSLFLAAAAALSLFMFYFPLAAFVPAIPEFPEGKLFLYRQVIGSNEYPTDSMLLSPFLAIVFALSVLALFLFQNRKRQMLIVKIAVVFTAAAMVMQWIFYTRILEKPENAGYEISFHPTFFFLLPVLIFLLLAHKGIARDEKLIKSLDRIR